MKQQFIVSTATNDNHFPIYGDRAPGRAPTVKGSITIKGKAGLPNKHLLTPRGVVTSVTSEELAELEKHKIYLRMRDNGWFTVVNADPRDADKIAADQAEGDGSKQLTKAELAKKSAAAKPKTD